VVADLITFRATLLEGGLRAPLCAHRFCGLFRYVPPLHDLQHMREGSHHADG